MNGYRAHILDRGEVELAVTAPNTLKSAKSDGKKVGLHFSYEYGRAMRVVIRRGDTFATSFLVNHPDNH